MWHRYNQTSDHSLFLAFLKNTWELKTKYGKTMQLSQSTQETRRHRLFEKDCWKTNRNSVIYNDHAPQVYMHSWSRTQGRYTQPFSSRHTAWRLVGSSLPAPAAHSQTRQETTRRNRNEWHDLRFLVQCWLSEWQIWWETKDGISEHNREGWVLYL